MQTPLLARFLNLAISGSVNLIVGFTIITQVATYKILGLCAPFASQIVADSLIFVA